MKILKIEVQSNVAVCFEEGTGIVLRPGWIDLKELIDAETESMRDAIRAIVDTECSSDRSS